jgi:nicotinate-nucleotide adenylyltransferase
VSRPWRLGILGGSFDPPHAGHLHAARAARAAFALDEVRFVPAARPPHKPGRVLASGADRAALVELLIAGEPDFHLDRRELERAGPSFTVETLRELAAEGDHELFLILGSDNLAGLADWRNVEEVLSLAQPVVVFRAGQDPDPLSQLEGRLSPEALARVRRGLVLIEPLPISSTELRAAARRGADAELPLALRDYIREHDLYRAESGGDGP